MSKTSSFKHHQGYGKGSGPLGTTPTDELWAELRAQSTTAQPAGTSLDRATNTAEHQAPQSASFAIQSLHGKDAFIAQCIRAVKDHPHTDIYGEWQRIFDNILESALNSHAVEVALNAPNHKLRNELFRALSNSALNIALRTDYPVDGPQITSRDFMLTRNEGERALNGGTKAAIGNFVKHCLENYGTLLETPEHEHAAQR